MARQFDFAGKSGAAYRYILLEDGQPLWPSGGNYIYVRAGERGPQVVYAGEAESLFRGYLDHWDRASKAYGATDIYLRLNISGSVRREEQADIVAKHEPAMNAAGAMDAPHEKPEKPKRARRSAKG
jgi:hypothetical protein